MRFKLISELQRCSLADSVTFRQRHAGCLVRVCKMMRSAKAGDKNVTSIKRQTGNAPQHCKRNTKTKWSTNQDEPGRVAETTRSKLMDTKEPKRGWRVVRSVSLAWGDGRSMENTLKPNITMSYDFWWRNASRRWKNTLQRADSWLLSLSSRCSLHGFVTGKALVRSVIAVSPAAIVRTCPASSPFISPVSRLGEKIMSLTSSLKCGLPLTSVQAAPQSGPSFLKDTRNKTYTENGTDVGTKQAN